MGIPRNLGRLKNFNEKMPQSLTKGFLSERAHQVASYVRVNAQELGALWPSGSLPLRCLQRPVGTEASSEWDPRR